MMKITLSLAALLVALEEDSLLLASSLTVNPRGFLQPINDSDFINREEVSDASFLEESETSARKRRAPSEPSTSTPTSRPSSPAGDTSAGTAEQGENPEQPEEAASPSKKPRLSVGQAAAKTPEELHKQMLDELKNNPKFKEQRRKLNADAEERYRRIKGNWNSNWRPLRARDPLLPHAAGAAATPRPAIPGPSQ